MLLWRTVNFLTSILSFYERVLYAALAWINLLGNIFIPVNFFEFIQFIQFTGCDGPVDLRWGCQVYVIWH